MSGDGQGFPEGYPPSTRSPSSRLAFYKHAHESRRQRTDQGRLAAGGVAYDVPEHDDAEGNTEKPGDDVTHTSTSLVHGARSRPHSALLSAPNSCSASLR